MIDLALGTHHLQDFVILLFRCDRTHRGNFHVRNFQSRVEPGAAIARQRILQRQNVGKNHDLLPNRSDKPIGAPAVFRALSDRVNTRNHGGEPVIHQDSSIAANVRGLCDVRVRLNSARQHHQVDGKISAVVERRPRYPLIARDGNDGASSADMNSRVLHLFAEHFAAGLIQLHTHQAAVELDNGDMEPEVAEDFCRFQPEQAAPQDCGVVAGLHVIANLDAIVQIAIREQPQLHSAAVCHSLDFRNYRLRPGRNDGDIVADRLPIPDGNHAGRGINPFGTLATQISDPLLAVPLHRLHHDFVNWLAAQDLPQEDAVVAAALFFSNDRDVIDRTGIAR